jgi:hypothetical protein
VKEISNKSTNRPVRVSSAIPRPGNFINWLNANKKSLKQENPSASDIEVMKIGMKLYKESIEKRKDAGILAMKNLPQLKFGEP